MSRLLRNSALMDARDNLGPGYLQLHFLNTSRAEPQIWGQWGVDQDTTKSSIPELIWSSDIPRLADIDSWTGADGPDRVVFLAAASHELKATIVRNYDLTMLNASLLVASAPGRVISPSIGYCAGNFFVAYFETVSNNPAAPGATLKLLRSNDSTAEAWNPFATVQTTPFAEKGSISDIICINSSSIAFSVRYGTVRNSSIVIYVVNDLSRSDSISSITIASSVTISSDLWAGLSLARVSEYWLVLKFSAQENTTLKWRSFYTFSHTSNLTIWSLPRLVAPPEDKQFLNQSSIQHSLACNGTHCISPNTRLLGSRSNQPRLESGAFWQTFTPNCSSSADVRPECFSGPGCDTSICSCFPSFEKDPAHPGECRSKCGNSQLDDGEECDGGVGCLPTTCRCDSSEGYTSDNNGTCVKTCLNTPVWQQCPENRPYRCGRCCAVAACQFITPQCPQAECSNSTCTTFSSSLEVCGSSCKAAGLQTCADGMCTPSLSKCPPVSACPSYTPRQSDGSCGTGSVRSCPTGLQNCIDGQCREDCSGLRQFGCPEKEVMCADGTCHPTCPESLNQGYYKCHSGEDGTIKSCPMPLLFIASQWSNMSVLVTAPPPDPIAPISVEFEFVSRQTPPQFLFRVFADTDQRDFRGNISASQLTYVETVEDLVNQSSILSVVAQVSWPKERVVMVVSITFAIDYNYEKMPVCLWSLDKGLCTNDAVNLSPPQEPGQPNATVTIPSPGRYAIKLNPSPGPVPPLPAPLGLVGVAAIIALGVMVVFLIALLMWVTMRYRSHRKRVERMGKVVVDNSRRKPTPARGPDNAWNIAYTALPAFSESHLKREFQSAFISASAITVGSKIGQGAYSTVHRGTYRGQDVAIKVANRGADADYVSSLRREAKTLLNLRSHPNIIHVLGVAEDEEKSYLVMELCAMGSVQRNRKKNKLGDLTDQYQIMLAVARALAHLHSFGVVHRDVAARNILLTDTKEVRLSDFGMSRRLPKGAKSGTFTSKHGPVRWMAPECFSQRQFSPASDVWAFANTVCEILSGREPFHDQDPEDVAFAVRDHATHPKIPSNCPHWLKKILASCWRKEPQQRPTMLKIAKRLAEHILPNVSSSNRRDDPEASVSSAKSTELTTLSVDDDSDGDGPPSRRMTATGLGLGPLPSSPNMNNPITDPGHVGQLVDTETFTDALEDSETYVQKPNRPSPPSRPHKKR